MSYTFDPTSARKADSYGGQISEIGAYKGVFTCVRETVSKAKGTKGIVFDFKSDQNQTAEFSLWVQNAQGEPLFGMDTLNAIMACIGTRNATPTQGTAKMYDELVNARVDKPATVLPELMDKRIGIMLETEDYETRNGDIRTRMVFAMPFKADGLFTASEILDKAIEPKIYHNRLASLRHRPLKGTKSSPRATNDIEDDIPF